MNFSYLRYVSVQNNARTEILRPVVPVDLAGPDGEIDFYGLVETGSDDTLIPRFLATALEILPIASFPGMAGLLDTDERDQ